MTGNVPQGADRVMVPLDSNTCPYDGNPLTPRPAPRSGSWGDWHCTWCGVAFCQECCEELDENDECPKYRNSVEDGVVP